MLVAAVLAAVAWRWGNPFLVAADLLALVTVIGFGVALPGWRLFGPFLCTGPASRRCVALTFDDGPDAASTPALLEVLRESGVEAAFFCVGERVAAHPELARQIVGAGHLLENHSYTHSHTTNLFSVPRLQADLTRTQKVIEQVTGTVPSRFRPPMGLSNPRVFRVARTLGLTVVGWSARGFDTRVTEPERVVSRIVRRLGPGAIILLHDGGIPAERLVVTVKMLLDRLRTLGYEVVRLDRMLTGNDCR